MELTRHTPEQAREGGLEKSGAPVEVNEARAGSAEEEAGDVLTLQLPIHEKN